MMDETVQIATVVWYNEKKGYGFVTIGDSEIFLHRSALERFGLSTVYATDKLHLTVTSNQRGDVVKEIMSIERAKSDTIPSDSEPLEDEVRGSVKFFNTAKGYGFVEVGDEEADVFVHLKTLRNFGIYHLNEGQKLFLKITDDCRGPQASEIRLLNFDD